MIGNEIILMKQLPSHPFIIQMHASFREGNSISLVLDLLSGGDLRVLLRLGVTFPEEEVAYIMACIASALRHIHLNRIIHRDLKPENIMLSSTGVPKLIDFGISYQVPTSSLVCICEARSGTKPYLAPEVFVSPHHYHGYESDFWSLGVIMHELLFQRRPFDTHVPIEMVKYSEVTYGSSWQELLHSATKEITQTSKNEYSSLSTHTQPPIEVSQDRAPWLQKSLYDYPPELFPSNLMPYSDSLRVPIPMISYLQESLPATCVDFLSSLLEVRIHKRLGGPRNSHDIWNHPYFISKGLSLETISFRESPVGVSLSLVAGHIWNRHFEANWDLFDSDENLPADSPSQEVEDYIHQYLPSYAQT